MHSCRSPIYFFHALARVTFEPAHPIRGSLQRNRVTAVQSTHGSPIDRPRSTTPGDYSRSNMSTTRVAICCSRLINGAGFSDSAGTTGAKEESFYTRGRVNRVRGIKPDIPARRIHSAPYEGLRTFAASTEGRDSYDSPNRAHTSNRGGLSVELRDAPRTETPDGPEIRCRSASRCLRAGGR